MTKVVVEHKDKLGRVLNIGDCVAYPQSNTLYVGTIRKTHNKMITVSPVGRDHRYNGSKKYSSDVVLLEGPQVTLYLLKLETK
jgi:hypothetical protein